MQKACLALAFLCLLASACSPAANQPPITASSVSPATQTLTLSPTLTVPPQPALTFAPPSVTPIPTIPTFTPAFDVRTIVTATPAPKAECPKVNANFVFLTPTPDLNLSVLVRQDIRQYILDFLNAGGEPEKIAKAFDLDKDSYYIKDLTGDGAPEFVLNNGNILIFGCVHKSYSLLFELGNPIPDEIFDIPNFRILYMGDMNLDGIPELLIGGRIGPGSISTFAHEIIGWNGQNFKQVSDNWLFTDGLGKDSRSIWTNWNIKDVDKNGTLELILSDGLQSGMDFVIHGPWRARTWLYAWNGKLFVLQKSEIEPPVYRFQAIQDADNLFSQKAYDRSLLLYQEAIFSDHLKPWSIELAENFKAFVQATYHQAGKPTPTPVAADPTEYSRLAAYAYYRMVILHIKLGEMDAAKTQYVILQEKFPAGNPGHPYAEMATNFWNAYQSSGKMYNACAAAIAYSDAHPEILTVLGRDYHGWQSHIYVPADVCPFR